MKGLCSFVTQKVQSSTTTKGKPCWSSLLLAEKSLLFFKSSVGAAVSGAILSVIATAKGTGVNIFEYLTHLQRFSKEVKKNPDLWAPWNYLTTLENIQKSDVLLKAA